MFTSVKAALTGFRFYIMGGLLAALLVLGVGWKIDHSVMSNKVKAAVAEKSVVDTKLQVSNASVTDLANQLNSVSASLVKKEADENALQGQLHDQLEQQKVKDQKLTDLSASLRQSVKDHPNIFDNNPVPKDAADAWNTLK